MEDRDVGFLFLHGAEAAEKVAVISTARTSAGNLNERDALFNNTEDCVDRAICQTCVRPCVHANNFLPHAKRHAALLEMKSAPAPLVAETQSADDSAERITRNLESVAMKDLDDDEHLRALMRFETRAMWFAGAVIAAVFVWWLV